MIGIILRVLNFTRIPSYKRYIIPFLEKAKSGCFIEERILLLCKLVIWKKINPIRILSRGRVFRNEAISSRSHCIFHQIEGLYIDENVSFAGFETNLQFSHYRTLKIKNQNETFLFPFTEPSAEVDVYWGLNSETDLQNYQRNRLVRNYGLEMVDPAVLKM